MNEPYKKLLSNCDKCLEILDELKALIRKNYGPPQQMVSEIDFIRSKEPRVNAEKLEEGVLPSCDSPPNLVDLPTTSENLSKPIADPAHEIVDEQQTNNGTSVLESGGEQVEMVQVTANSKFPLPDFEILNDTTSEIIDKQDESVSVIVPFLVRLPYLSEMMFLQHSLNTIYMQAQSIDLNSNRCQCFDPGGQVALSFPSKVSQSSAHSSFLFMLPKFSTRNNFQAAKLLCEPVSKVCERGFNKRLSLVGIIAMLPTDSAKQSRIYITLKVFDQMPRYFLNFTIECTNKGFENVVVDLLKNMNRLNIAPGKSTLFCSSAFDIIANNVAVTMNSYFWVVKFHEFVKSVNSISRKVGFLIQFCDKGSEGNSLSQSSLLFANFHPDNIATALEYMAEQTFSKGNGLASAFDLDVAMTDDGYTVSINVSTSTSTWGTSSIEGISKSSYVKHASNIKGSSVKVLNCHESNIYILAPLRYAIIYGSSRTTADVVGNRIVSLMYVNFIPMLLCNLQDFDNYILARANHSQRTETGLVIKQISKEMLIDLSHLMKIKELVKLSDKVGWCMVVIHIYATAYHEKVSAAAGVIAILPNLVISQMFQILLTPKANSVFTTTHHLLRRYPLFFHLELAFKVVLHNHEHGFLFVITFECQTCYVVDVYHRKMIDRGRVHIPQVSFRMGLATIKGLERPNEIARPDMVAFPVDVVAHHEEIGSTSHLGDLLKFGVALILVLAHYFPTPILPSLKWEDSMAIFHRKMIDRRRIHDHLVVIKWKTLPLKHGTWKYSSLRTRMFERGSIVTGI